MGVLWMDAMTLLGDVIRELTRRRARFAVLEDGEDVYAFTLEELEDTGSPDVPAKVALALEPWKASARASGPGPGPGFALDVTAPSTLRTVVFDENGRPAAVREDNGAEVLMGGPAAHRESTEIVRYPSIAVAERPAGMRITLDLALGPDAATLADPIRFDTLDEGWRELPVTVRVSSPQLEIEPAEGTIVIRRDQPSRPFGCFGIPKTDGPIEITAIFIRDDRWCGTAKRIVRGANTATTGSVAFVQGARAPDLTVHIHRTADDPKNANSRRRLVWTLVPAADHRALVTRSVAESVLPEDPAAYARRLFQRTAATRPPAHVAMLAGIGERLWSLAPRELHESYWAMRDALGDGFSIQFLTDEPHIPWELMRPVKDGEQSRMLVETHPVARGFQEYPDRLRPTLPGTGAILTIAPDYRHRGAEFPPLPGAAAESAMLRAEFDAVCVAATAQDVINAFSDAAGNPVRVLHFAGHARAVDDVESSFIACEDDDVSVDQVRHSNSILGERYSTFVVFNACEIGATGDALGAIGGWGEAFAYRKFSGFVAPLWAVIDDDASDAIRALFTRLLNERKSVGEALRDIRSEFGAISPTYLSYVYYGDVNARFA